MQVGDTDAHGTYDDPFVPLNHACAGSEECLDGGCFVTDFPCGGAAPVGCLDDPCDAGHQVCVEDSCGDAVCLDHCDTNPLQCSAVETCGADGHCAPILCCTTPSVCSADQVCEPARPGADHHGCAAASCVMDGFVCADLCDTTHPARDAHGCARDACAVDADCPTGRCGGGFCSLPLRVEPA